ITLGVGLIREKVSDPSVENRGASPRGPVAGPSRTEPRPPRPTVHRVAARPAWSERAGVRRCRRPHGRRARPRSDRPRCPDRSCHCPRGRQRCRFHRPPLQGLLREDHSRCPPRPARPRWAPAPPPRPARPRWAPALPPQPAPPRWAPAPPPWSPPRWAPAPPPWSPPRVRKSTRLNSSHASPLRSSRQLCFSVSLVTIAPPVLLVFVVLGGLRLLRLGRLVLGVLRLFLVSLLLGGGLRFLLRGLLRGGHRLRLRGLLL